MMNKKKIVLFVDNCNSSFRDFILKSKLLFEQVFVISIGVKSEVYNTRFCSEEVNYLNISLPNGINDFQYLEDEKKTVFANRILDLLIIEGIVDSNNIEGYVFVFNLIRASYLIALIKNRLNGQVVTYVDHNFDSCKHFADMKYPRNSLINLENQKSLNESDLVLVNSRSRLEFISKTYVVKEKQLDFLCDGSNLSKNEIRFFKKEGQALRSRMGFLNTEKVIFYFGPDNKNLSAMIAAFERVSRSCNVKLIIWGEYDFKKLLSQFENLWHKIHLTGRTTKDIFLRLMATADVVISLPLEHEVVYDYLDAVLLDIPLITTMILDSTLLLDFDGIKSIHHSEFTSQIGQDRLIDCIYDCIKPSSNLKNSVKINDFYGLVLSEKQRKFVSSVNSL